MQIQDLKNRLNIIDIAHHLGIHLDRNHRARCPFHDDKTPSLQFSKEKNIATCFSGNCSLGTVDGITLTEKLKKLSTHDAILWLSQLVGEVMPVSTGPGIVRQTIGKGGSGELARLATLKKAFTFFENSFMGSSPAPHPQVFRRTLGITS